jgi:hypothetical protein
VNALSHRAEHQAAATAFCAYTWREPHIHRAATGEELRAVRRAVAARRRDEQRAARVAAGTDRATLRAMRGAR